MIGVLLKERMHVYGIMKLSDVSRCLKKKKNKKSADRTLNCIRYRATGGTCVARLIYTGLLHMVIK